MPESLPSRRLRFEFQELAWVALGAVPGALLRWQSAVQLGPWIGGSAGADLLVNLVGSFVLGFLAGPIPYRTNLVLLLGIGFCGCLTTFSSWMLDVVKLMRAGLPGEALLLIVVSLALGLLFAAGGLLSSRRLFRARA
ncbi:MAG: CrcB family protein [Cyanobacteria bacterium M_surface_10_m1_298]|nr:CrcB family protein [Cyanobacteria bacterium M_surface_10_m1_298]